MAMQLHLLNVEKNAKDTVYTPDDVARDIVEFYQPTGKCLDPCRGEGAFYKFLPQGSDWCEVREGRDFFQYNHRVDWIISNPPYSVFSQFLRHSFNVADNIVYLIPVNKAFNSFKMMKDISEWGGIPHIYVVSSGGKLGWDIGFAIGAVYFKRGFSGGTQTTFRKTPPNKPLHGTPNLGFNSNSAHALKVG